MIHIKNGLVLGVVASLSGCFSLSGTSIPVVDMPTASNNCGAEKSAYVHPNSKFAVCVDKRLANFMYCVNAFSLDSVSSTEKAKFEVDLGQYKQLLDSAAFRKSDEREIIESFAKGGLLEKARAEAIDTCKTFLNEAV